TGPAALTAAVDIGGTFDASAGSSLDVKVGNLTLSGKLLLGPGSRLSSSGLFFTQATTGLLDVQIGGAPASGQFSQVRVTGQASLNGSLSAHLVNHFVPSNGQSFPVLTFARSSGTVRTTLPPSFWTRLAPGNLTLSVDTRPPTSQVKALPA